MADTCFPFSQGFRKSTNDVRDSAGCCFPVSQGFRKSTTKLPNYFSLSVADTFSWVLFPSSARFPKVHNKASQLLFSPVQKVTLETAVSPVFKVPKIGKSAVLTHFSDVF